VLRRPIETTRVTGRLATIAFQPVNLKTEIVIGIASEFVGNCANFSFRIGISQIFNFMLGI
jgi:hypothetical protein